MSTYKDRVPVEDRFWARVDKTDECWLWTGWVSPSGYGSINSGGTPKAIRVHRLSWQLHYGPIPEGMIVCHTCDVPNCVRPDHLFLGDNAANTADMVAKGRHSEQSKTECPSGHPYSEENTYRDKSGKRACRECRKAKSHRNVARTVASHDPANCPKCLMYGVPALAVSK